MLTQVRVSESVGFFRDNLKKIYNLADYYDPSTPCLFVGQYTPEDRQALLSHTGPSIVVWAGIDCKKAHNDADINIVCSPQQTPFFDKAGIPYEYIAFCWTPDILSKQPIYNGTKVYCYAPNEIYGRSIAEELAKEYPMVLTTDKNQYTKEELEIVYADTFINLRLRNQYDGSATTVQECGLRGIPSVYNGDMPYSLQWNNIHDIRRHLNNFLKLSSVGMRRCTQSAFIERLSTAINQTVELFKNV